MREKIFLFFIIIISTVSTSSAQDLINSDTLDMNHSTLELRGNIYGVADEHTYLVFDGIPDSLWIDTLSVRSALVLFKNGEVYQKVDSAKRFSFFVEIGHEYLLLFIHPDYVSKSVVVDATTIPEFGEDLVMTIKMSMFSPEVATKLTEPLSVAKYNHQIEKMDWDMGLFEKQVAKMLKME